MEHPGHAVLAGILPAPKGTHAASRRASTEDSDLGSPQAAQQPERRVVPAYPNRKGFVPMKNDDFSDGGAYPEIHIIQYPLNMGKPGQKSSALVPVQLSESGTLRTDLIVKQGTNSSKIVQTSLADMKEKKVKKESLALPDEGEVVAAAEKTRLALEAITNSKIKSSKPTSISASSSTEVEPTYIQYTPNPNAPGYNASASQRIVKMVEAQVDPMEPPKHKHTKAPRGPPPMPVPVLHSPPRKLTVEDQQAWKIPPCVSNWVNARGFIIPLDKRLAADGRGLQETTINNKFAMLAESLYITERKAVQDLNVRNELRKKIALREKEEREQQLRDMANRARLERSGVMGGGGQSALPDYRSDEEEERGGGVEERKQRGREADSGGWESDDDNGDRSDEDEGAGDNSADAQMARQQRERIRMERRKEREREMRLDNLRGAQRKSKADRDEGRDISEKIALGMLKGTGQLTGEAAFDNRLFNQSAGIDRGFGQEDDYNVYTRPLFDRGEAGSIYRPKGGDGDIYGGGDGGGGGGGGEGSEEAMAKLLETSRFRPDKGFKGAEGGGRGAGPRDAPVQFEKAAERDPYARRDDRGERKSRRSESRERSGRDERDRRRDWDRRDRSASPPRGSKRARHDYASDED